jgi:hypothetical protein
MMQSIEPLAARASRAPQTKSSDDATTQEQSQAERALAIRKQAFDEMTAERAEFEREREALEELMLAQLKDEDAVLKKWIEMI